MQDDKVSLATLLPSEFTREELRLLQAQHELRTWLIPLMQALRESPSKWLN